MTAEKEGGPKGLLKNMLIGDRQLGAELKEGAIRIEFLKKMIPLIRSHSSQMQRMADGQIAIDVLKFDMDVASMSRLRRVIVRRIAKTDPEYERPVPPEILFAVTD
jgi:hypothetical protein